MNKFIRNLKSPTLFKYGLRMFAPYLGAGVKIDYIDKNWKELKVSMNLHFYNKNIIGTHFGGSLYSMTDPHVMLLLMQSLGTEYIIWDKSANIDFIKPGIGKVEAIIKISDDTIKKIKENTKNGDKYLPKFKINITDKDKNIVAIVNKTLYVRRKQKIAKK